MPQSPGHITMGRKDMSRTLTLDRFASGKDGRVNAFKKKKQANKRKLFEKAQLKRRYAKLLKKESIANISPPSYVSEAAEFGPTGETGADGETRSTHVIAYKRRKEEAVEAEDQGGRDGETQRGRAQEREPQGDGTGKTESGERRKSLQQQHRPDPLKKAKAKAEQRRQEKEEDQRERQRQKAEKESRAKQRRKRHALLSKRTRGGQPVMKHTMQHLLEKIQAEQAHT